MEIRLLTAADAERYRNLRLQALQHSPEAFLMTYEEEASQTDSLQQYREKLQRESSYTYGIFKGAELVGIGTLQAEKPLKVRHKGNVFAMYVAQGERGGGLVESAAAAADSTSPVTGSGAAALNCGICQPCCEGIICFFRIPPIWLRGTSIKMEWAILG
ncbi:acetyltransferase, GNAT family [Bacillus badius]|uniref:Acetyltransferase, GNAT family n=1 Tax=Bacillus badius TaxID=1455 RepID=A0ABR5AR72_BACBA|nr:acetyltransferase, GNAT family [Bacillus badius]